MSESSNDERRCPSCGTVIPPEAPQGLCPRCVLAGVASEDADSLAATRTAAQSGMEPPSLEEIRAAFPQFEILELIGSGGMGAVFKVRQPRLDRLVALKVLPKSLAGDQRFTERFTREARTLAKLSHPNIVSVHDFGQSEIGGLHFLLMEYVDGANLREAMRAGRFTPEQAFAVVPEICAALQYAHDEGVLHRDIKPENLLLDTRGRLKIVDFGIAKLIGAEAEAPLTGSYAPGTPQYMAPEQIEHPQDVDHRADIYSLGVVFYEMLTGELPIGRFAAPSERSAVGGNVDDIVFRTLEKEPSRRQQSAGEVKTQVEGLADTPPPPLSPPLAAAASPGDLPGRAASGRTENSRRAVRALMLLVTSVVVMLISWGILLGVVYQQRSADLNERAQRSVEINSLTEQAVKLEKQADYARENGLPVENIDALLGDAEETRGRIYELTQQVRESRGPGALMLLLLVIFIIVCVLVGIGLILATVRGWQALRALRFCGEHRGRVLAMIAALLVPALLMSALIFVIIALPARGTWVGPALSLSVIGILAANTWLVMRVLRWMKTPPTGEELAVWNSRSQGTAAASHEAKKTGGGLRWVTALLVAVILGPIVIFGAITLIGICVAWLTTSFDSSEEDRLRATRVEEEVKKTQAVAVAREAGKDLASKERMLVGSWRFDQGLDVGNVHFTADRKWRMETADGKLAMSGTWKIGGDVLEQTVEASSESEQVGRVIRADIIKLIDGKPVELRDQEGGDTLILLPVEAMSKIKESALFPAVDPAPTEILVVPKE